jgi:dTDP-4-dehydrorhamnose reductase
MNILLAGSSGQLGTELYPLLGQLGDLSLVDLKSGTHATIEQDLSDLDQFESLLDRIQPDLVVNAVAYTAVDQAENNRELAFKLNAGLPERMASWCRRHQSNLLHYSTDYVFDGQSKQPYREFDTASPLNVYGESKLAGESVIRDSGCNHLILRTSWVYSTHGSNFLLTMLRLARERPQLGVVSDQTGCPTWAKSLARASLSLLQALQTGDDWKTKGGLYHYCDATTTTWYDFANLIFETAESLGILPAIPKLDAIRTADFPQLASRPRYSVLDTRALCETFAYQPPTLEQSLLECLRDYRPST